MPTVIAAGWALDRGELTRELYDEVVRGALAMQEAAVAFGDLPREERIRARTIAEYDKKILSGWSEHPGKAAYYARKLAEIEDYREYGEEEGS